MKARRAHTLLEVVVASTVLLLMVAAASMSVVSSLRIYRQMNQRTQRTQAAMQTMESLLFRLRSATRIQSTVPGSLRQGPVDFSIGPGQAYSLFLEEGKLKCSSPSGLSELGPALDLHLSRERDFLRVQLVFDSGPPLAGSLSLKGIELR